MKAIMELIAAGWEITLRRSLDGFYIEARESGEYYMGYDQFKLSAAIHDVKKKMRTAGIK